MWDSFQDLCTKRPSSDPLSSTKVEYIVMKTTSKYLWIKIFIEQLIGGWTRRPYSNGSSTIDVVVAKLIIHNIKSLDLDNNRGAIACVTKKAIFRCTEVECIVGTLGVGGLWIKIIIVVFDLTKLAKKTKILYPNKHIRVCCHIIIDLVED